MSASARSSAATAAAASGMYADVAFADVKLGRARRLARDVPAARLNRKDESEVARSSAGGGAADGLDPGEESPVEESESVEESARGYDELRDALAAAESSAAAALTACEALGVLVHIHRRALWRALFLRMHAWRWRWPPPAMCTSPEPSSRAKGRGGVGDGAGVMFAEGLYRNALRLMGTPRPPTSTADDADAAAGGAGAGAPSAVRGDGPRALRRHLESLGGRPTRARGGGVGGGGGAGAEGAGVR